MRIWPNIASKKHAGILLCALAAATLPNCGPDYYAINNHLRHQSMAQDQQIADLKQKLATSKSHATQLQAQVDGRLPRVETLPDSRLNDLFTAARVVIESQTDSWEADGNKGLTLFRVFLRTYSDDGVNIPATGALTIEAFELPPAPAAPVRLGTWNFTAAEMKKNWYSDLGLNQFALNCPWSRPPKTASVSFRVTLTDSLTGRLLETQLNKKITLPK